MKQTNCPNVEELTGYVEGTLDEQFLDTVAEHIEQCVQCGEQIQNLEPGQDALIQKLRGGRPAEKFIDEPSCINAVAKVSTALQKPKRQQIPAILRESQPPTSTEDSVMVEATIGTLAEQLVASRIISTQHVAACGASIDDDQLLQELIAKGAVTDWQAKQVKSGRMKSLLLAQYKLLQPIGAGGMGQVFKAQDTRLNRLVAIKVVSRDHASSTERFLQEAKAALQLQHPCIVRSFELGQHGKHYFLVMELVDGMTLKQYIQQGGRLSLEQTAFLAYEILRALDHAHRAGIIHRDIKPSNIMVTNDGQVKLADMGLAKMFQPGQQASDDLTRTGAFMGTVDYCAPEQAEDAKHASPQSDIYALGCTLYHCLTGHAPFPEGTEVQKIVAHRERQPALIESENERIPPDFSSLIQSRMMAKQPSQRFQSATEAGLQFRPWIGDQAIRDEMARLSEAVLFEKRARAIAKPATVPAQSTVVKAQASTYPQSSFAAPQQPDKVMPISFGLAAILSCGLLLGFAIAGGYGYWVWKGKHKLEPGVARNSNAENSSNGTSSRPMELANQSGRKNASSNRNTSRAGNPSLGPIPAGTDLDVERRVAEQVIRLGGRVATKPPGSIRTGIYARIDSVEKLPADPFVIASVSFSKAKVIGSLRDNDLAILHPLKSIDAFSITNFPITASGLRHIHDLTSLRKITLSHSDSLTDDALAELQGMVNLKELAIHATQVTGTGFSHLLKLTNLIHIELHSCPISDSGMSTIGQMKHLEHLQFLSSPVTDVSLGNLGEMPNLRYLGLAGSKVTDDGLKLMDQFPKLKSIFLGYTEVSDDGIAHLANSKNLTGVFLEETQITNKSLKFLGELPSLGILGIRDNPAITDVALSHLNNSKNLRLVLLTGTSVTSNGARAFKATKKQCTVDLLDHRR